MKLAKEIIPEEVWEKYPQLDNSLGSGQAVYMRQFDVPKMNQQLRDGLQSNGVVYQTQYDMMTACTKAEKGKYNAWHEVRKVRCIASGFGHDPVQFQYSIPQFCDLFKSVKLSGNPTSANLTVGGEVIHELDLTDTDENGFVPIYKRPLNSYLAPYGMRFINVQYDECPEELNIQIEGVTIEPVLVPILRAAFGKDY